MVMGFGVLEIWVEKTALGWLIAFQEISRMKMKTSDEDYGDYFFTMTMMMVMMIMMTSKTMMTMMLTTTELIPDKIKNTEALRIYK